MEPIFLNPTFKEYVWGGRKISSYLNKQTPFEKVSESWEISANKNGLCKVRNGEFINQTLLDIYKNEKLKVKLFGVNCKDIDEFPILVKYIDANDKLSVQVHPDNAYAKRYENSNGKDEMWYIIDCDENAQIVCGFKDNVKKENVKDIVYSNEIVDYLNFIKIKKGDVICIKAGTVHALLGNTLVCEIQQNSDLTYRLYDWNRKDKNGNSRELHREKALDVINIESKIDIKNKNNEQVQQLYFSDFFKTELINVNKEWNDKVFDMSFYAFSIVDGNGILSYNEKEYKIKLGDSFILPANFGKYSIKGNIKLLKTYIGG